MKSERVRQVSPVENSGRQRIVATARRHFFAYGFRAVTMDDIARELGMSKKTLYAHFPSKAALVEAVLLDKIRRVETDLKRITSSSSSNFLTTLHQLLARVQMHLEEIQPPFLRDLRREAPEMFALVETRRREMIHQYFGRLVGAGQAEGIIREDVPTELIVEILLGATQAIMNPEKLTELGLTPREGFSAIITVIFRGVVTEMGRATL
ncbi:MAG: TetR/AcrR family transcriptional regulator [Syntrophaceae bacterium]|nr:TetR/AcrR family transcriptional regulator [Syntrophaceae bacterium]